MTTMARPEDKVADGLDKVAHAIRRSAALRAAVSLTDEAASVDDVLDVADRLAVWVGGRAAAAQAQRQEEHTPLGEPWPPQ